MPPKRGGSGKGGKAKKAKVPTYYTYEDGYDHLAVFGVRVRAARRRPPPSPPAGEGVPPGRADFFSSN